MSKFQQQYKLEGWEWCRAVTMQRWSKCEVPILFLLWLYQQMEPTSSFKATLHDLDLSQWLLACVSELGHESVNLAMSQWLTRVSDLGHASVALGTSQWPCTFVTLSQSQWPWVHNLPLRGCLPCQSAARTYHQDQQLCPHNERSTFCGHRTQSSHFLFYF